MRPMQPLGGSPATPERSSGSGDDPAAAADDVARRRRALRAEADRLVAADRWRAAIDLLQRSDLTGSDGDLARRLVRLRHTAAAHVESPERGPTPPTDDDLPAAGDGLPEVPASRLDATVLASAIAQHGALLVRGLIPVAGADRLVDAVDRAWEGREAFWSDGGRGAGAPWFRPFVPDPGTPAPSGRRADARGCALWAADAPLLLHAVLDVLGTAGVVDLAEAYLGEPPLLNVRKAVARRVPPDLASADWHQDGAFLDRTGDLRAVNAWVALTACGQDAPGVELVPGRLPILETGSDGACFPWSVGQGLVEGRFGATPPLRPRFEVGDALLFDHHLLHRTALDADMVRRRYSLEWWCFGGSTYPAHGVPLVV